MLPPKVFQIQVGTSLTNFLNESLIHVRAHVHFALYTCILTYSLTPTHTHTHTHTQVEDACIAMKLYQLHKREWETEIKLKERRILKRQRPDLVPGRKISLQHLVSNSVTSAHHSTTSMYCHVKIWCSLS